jgi:hypothetical protein
MGVRRSVRLIFDSRASYDAGCRVDTMGILQANGFFYYQSGHVVPSQRSTMFLRGRCCEDKEFKLGWFSRHFISK